MAHQEGESSNKTSIPEGAIRTMHQDLERLRSQQKSEKGQSDEKHTSKQSEASAEEQNAAAASQKKEGSSGKSTSSGTGSLLGKGALVLATIAVLATAGYTWTVFGLSDNALRQWEGVKQWASGTFRSIEVSIFPEDQKPGDATPSGTDDTSTDQQATSTPETGDKDGDSGTQERGFALPVDRVAVVTIAQNVSGSTVRDNLQTIQSNVADSPGEFVLVDLRRQNRKGSMSLAQFFDLIGLSSDNFALSNFLQDTYSVFWHRGEDGKYYPGLAIPLQEPGLSGKFVKIVPAFRQNGQQLATRFANVFLPEFAQDTEPTFVKDQFDVEAILQKQQEIMNGRRLHFGVFFQKGWLLVTSSQASLEQLLPRLP